VTASRIGVTSGSARNGIVVGNGQGQGCHLSGFVGKSTLPRGRTTTWTAATHIGHPCTIGRDAEDTLFDLFIKGLKVGTANKHAVLAILQMTRDIGPVGTQRRRRRNSGTVYYHRMRMLWTSLVAAATCIRFPGLNLP